MVNVITAPSDFHVVSVTPANMRHWPSVVLMLARRLRRRSRFKTTLDQRLVFAVTDHTSIQGPERSPWHQLLWSDLYITYIVLTDYNKLRYWNTKGDTEVTHNRKFLYTLKTRHCINGGWMLGQCHRRWPSIEPPHRDVLVSGLLLPLTSLSGAVTCEKLPCHPGRWYRMFT